MTIIYKSFARIFIFSIILFSVSKATMRIVSIPEIILLILFFFFLLRAMRSNLKIQGSPYFWLGILLFIVMLAGIMRAFYKGYYNLESFKYLARHIEYLIIIFLTINLVSSIRRAREIMSSIMILAIPVSILAFFQKLLGPQMSYILFPWGPAWTIEYTYSNYRVYSFFDNPNYLGVFMVFLVALAGAHFFFGGANGVKRICYLLLFFVSLGIVILTGSRTAILGSAVVVLVTMLLKFSIKRLAFMIFILTIFVFSILYFFPKTQTVFFHHESNITNRFLAYNSAIRMIRDNLILGIGVGNYSQVYKESYKNNMTSSNPVTFTAENNFLENMAQVGLFGILIYISFFLLFFQNLYHAFHIAHANDIRCISMALGIAMTGFLISSLFVVVNTVPLNMILWLFFGLAEALKNLAKGRSTEQNQTSLFSV